MTNLTEKWRKGELETNKYYYVRDLSYILPAKLGKYDNQLYFSGNEVGYGYEENTELEILAPVPSYQDYERLNWYAGNGVEENTKLKTENKWYSEQLNEAVKEVAKLKELLKEVQSKIRYSSPRGIETFADLDDTLLGKINQVLGEE